MYLQDDVLRRIGGIQRKTLYDRDHKRNALRLGGKTVKCFGRGRTVVCARRFQTKQKRAIASEKRDVLVHYRSLYRVWSMVDNLIFIFFF